jgi:hypothetical protein
MMLLHVQSSFSGGGEGWIEVTTQEAASWAKLTAYETAMTTTNATVGVQPKPKSVANAQ